jgi:hypothetical protein
VGVEHDGAAFDIAVLLEETRDITLGQTRMDAGDEQIRAAVDCAFFIDILHASVRWGWWGSVTTVGRSAAVAIISISARRGRPVATLVATVILVTSCRVLEISHSCWD